jgi:hypothetical protein
MPVLAYAGLTILIGLLLLRYTAVSEYRIGGWHLFPSHSEHSAATATKPLCTLEGVSLSAAKWLEGASSIERDACMKLRRKANAEIRETKP